jgi:hypothetical protein
MALSAPSAWIDDGEKYALVGLTIKFEGNLPPGKITSNLSVLADTKFSVPPNWRTEAERLAALGCRFQKRAKSFQALRDRGARREAVCHRHSRCSAGSLATRIGRSRR